MKRTGLILITALLFLLSLYVAYVQGYLYTGAPLQDSTLVSAIERPQIIASGLLAILASLFFDGFNSLTTIFNGSMVAAIVVLALLVELITLYPAVSIQLKQKKIHLFHKKLVDRFKSGELALSESKREMHLLYAVNEQIHRRGALLFAFQVFVFALVISGLYVISLSNNINLMAIGSFNFSMLAPPVEVYLPVLAALAYLLHALIKIYLKQKEDYISSSQINVALIFAILSATVVFFFAGNFAILLTVYFMTQITFATMRYVIVEEKSKVWRKLARKELIKMLQSAKTHKNKVEHVSRKFNHLPLARHFNSHLLEEGISMSLALVLAVTSSNLI